MNAAITPSVKGQISTEAQADIPESLQTLSSIVSAPCEIDVYLWSHLQKYYMEQGEDENLVYLGFFAFIATLLSLGLAIGVVIALGSLLFIQAKIIMRNETTIENWIVSKAQMRERDNEEDEFVYPYNLGVAENLKQVFVYPLGDGITWPVVSGCNQYTLTVSDNICAYYVPFYEILLLLRLLLRYLQSQTSWMTGMPL